MTAVSRRILRVRPARPLAPIGITMAILAGWWLVAHNSGAGWVQALGDVAFGTLVVGIVGPAVVVGRARVRVVEAPTDATAGLPVEVVLAASARLRVRPVEPPGMETFVGPVRKQRQRSGMDTATLVAPRRGIHDVLVVDVATAAPFALQWWTRRMVLPLPSTLFVSPRRGRPAAIEPRANDRTGDTNARVAANLGEPRGARPYRPGDDRRHVHWQAFAHTGELMVRELEAPAAEPVTLQVALPADRDEAERVAERALGTVVYLLDRGAPVVLETVEGSGPVRGAVEDRRAAGRRLARAVSTPGNPHAGPFSPEPGIEVAT
jgi:uncharacterized protein (DUF58 family)